MVLIKDICRIIFIFSLIFGFSMLVKWAFTEDPVKAAQSVVEMAEDLPEVIDEVEEVEEVAEEFE